MLDLLLVIYDFEEKNKAFLRRSFFSCYCDCFIFCPSNPRGYRQAK